MNIIYIHRANFNKRPPVISCVLNLLSLNHNVVLITTGITNRLRDELETKGAQIIIVPYKMHNNFFELITHTIKYRNQIKKILKRFKMNNYVLWIEGNYTIGSLFGIINNYSYILQIQELHKNKIEFHLIKQVIHKALIVFMPEYNRAFLYKVFFKLKDIPTILPNKPYFIPSTEEMNILKNKYSDIIRSIEGRKIILYQGGLSKERDSSPFIKAISKLENKYVLILMGKDYGVMEQYKSLDRNIIHIPFISAPDYLVITSLAYIGIVTYVPDSLNTIYCAPNKIFEYSAFSIPIIANDIPGLKYPIQQFSNGIIIDDKDYNSIISAIKTIENNYYNFSISSRNFYDSIDNKKIIENALNNIP